MSRPSRRKRAVPVQSDPPWTDFERATMQGEHFWKQPEGTWSVWKNSRYTVLVRRMNSIHADAPPALHLSIKRNDRKPILNWRDVQKIKNVLVGPECEGVQVFPAESRLVDTSNQYHLFVFFDPAFTLGLGFSERLVSEVPYETSVQEPFEPHVRPDDLESSDTLAARIAETENAN